MINSPPAEIVAPEAGALSESLRSFGYSTQAALADLVDNSVSAGAKRIWIHFEWAGSDSWIAVRDDGNGMAPDALRDAMRAGSRSPLSERPPRDLGRFGLGLKTASFSQCRRLTVATKSVGGPPSTRRWDLDHIAATGEWWLLHGAASGSESRLVGQPELPSGTTVLWEQLDRLVGQADVRDQRAHARFLEMVDVVDVHLAMLFHRFLERGLQMWLNGRPVRAWDPFMQRDPATQRLAPETLTLHGRSITVQPYVLPHVSKLTPEAHGLGAGPEGWNAQQGFYVYRGDRLLVAGGWLGLGLVREEHYKLARISIDLTNAQDRDWDIDVRKSRARPPGLLRDDLRRISRVTRQRASEVFRHRGKVLARSTSQDYVFIWNRLQREGRVSYRVNRSHPLVEAALEQEPDPGAVRAMLRLLEETLPVPTILIDAAEHPDAQAQPFEGSPPAAVMDVLLSAYRQLRRRGLSPSQSRERLASMDPFQDRAALIETLNDQEAEGHA
jgi:hypothetical protein